MSHVKFQITVEAWEVKRIQAIDAPKGHEEFGPAYVLVLDHPEARNIVVSEGFFQHNKVEVGGFMLQFEENLLVYKTREQLASLMPGKSDQAPAGNAGKPGKKYSLVDPTQESEVHGHSVVNVPGQEPDDELAVKELV
jgi:hypothetical protein